MSIKLGLLIGIFLLLLCISIAFGHPTTEQNATDEIVEVAQSSGNIVRNVSSLALRTAKNAVPYVQQAAEYTLDHAVPRALDYTQKLGDRMAPAARKMTKNYAVPAVNNAAPYVTGGLAAAYTTGKEWVAKPLYNSVVRPGAHLVADTLCSLPAWHNNANDAQTSRSVGAQRTNTTGSRGKRPIKRRRRVSIFGMGGWLKKKGGGDSAAAAAEGSDDDDDDDDDH